MRLFGMRYGYYPLDLTEQYRVDFISDAFYPLINATGAVFYAGDKQKELLMELFEKKLPAFIKLIQPELDKGGWLVGNKLTIADYWVGKLYTDLAINPNSYGRAEWAAFLKKNPKFEQFGKRFFAEN